MSLILVHDEFDGDAGRTVWPALSAPFAWCKALTGLGDPGNERNFAAVLPKAHTARVKLGAYHWFIARDDGAAQAEKFCKVAAGADAYAVDMEAGDNAGATTGTVLHSAHAFFDRFHALKPNSPLVIYGASWLDGLGISWSELVGSRDYVLAWLPRYAGGGDIRTWTREQVLVYARNNGVGHYRASVPTAKIALCQYTDGTNGPVPHSLPGLNRTEDLSVLLVTLDTITGTQPRAKVRYEVSKGTKKFPPRRWGQARRLARKLLRASKVGEAVRVKKVAVT